MALSAGTRLGPYEILAPLGAGGMGEVYRAKDTRLDRTVAIKVLPSHLSDDARLKERFEREARAVSSLNHPHICTLHDVGREGETDFLVMEYLEGETLAHRLEKGPLPLEQALRHATEIADALDKAHRQGVVHRDLKPGNVMLTKSGAKLLDFGLAKLRGSGGEAEASRASALPTEDRPLTEEGTILGTYPYMSPEQLEGREADARSDLFAFGTVLYEMATGKRAFEGKSRASLIAAIMSSEPRPMSELQPLTPSAVDHLVRTCLAKDPEERRQTAHDLVTELGWIQEAGSQAGVPSPIAARRRSRARLAWLACGILIGALLAGLALWSLGPTATPWGVVRVRMGVRPAELLGGALPLERESGLHRPSQTGLWLLPDGSRLVFAGGSGGTWRLYLRRMDEAEAVPLPGTEGAVGPFLSPDGQWVGFRTGDRVEGELKKVPVDGGLPVTLCETSVFFGASWGPDDSIVFAQGVGGGLWRVPAEGGSPEELTTLESGEFSHRLPHVLPGGEAVLFTVLRALRGWHDAEIVVQELATGERRVLIEGGADARYVPTGHLLFARQGTLMAAPFDLARLEVTGGSVPVVDGVMQAVNAHHSLTDTGAAQFSVSDSGSLVYLPGGIFPERHRPLVWLDRKGTVQPLDAPPRAYHHPRLSPDGKHVAVGVGRDGIRVFDIPRGVLSPLTRSPSIGPVWTPDGERVAYTSFGGESDGLFWAPADGSGVAECLTTRENMGQSALWSPDGGDLVFVESDPTTLYDIWVLRRGDGEHETRPIVRTPFKDAWPALSPDGRWLAYSSDESGRLEVYVQPYPGPGARTQVSIGGGSAPAWTRNGRELVYRRPGDERGIGKMMAVEIMTDPGFAAEMPRGLFDDRYSTFEPTRGYDVTPDGQRFLMLERREPPIEPAPQFHLVLNWFDELKDRVPVD